jgi:hypothetical protein
VSRPLLMSESSAPRVLYAAGLSCVAACERCGEIDCGDCGDEHAARLDDERRVTEFEHAYREGRW